MQFSIISNLGFRNVWRQKRRSLVMIAAVASALWGSISLAALARGVSDQMARESIRELTGHIKIQHPDYLRDPVVNNSFIKNSKIDLALSDPRVISWASRVRIPGVISSERESYGITLVGIDPSEEAGVSFIGDAPIVGMGISSVSEPGIIIGKKLLDNLQTEIGRRVVLMTQDRENKIRDRGFKIIGAFDAELESTETAYIFLGRETLRQLVGYPEMLSEVSILAKDRDKIADLMHDLKVALPELDVQPWTTLQPLAAAILKIQNGFLSIWFGVVIFTVSFGLINTLFMAIYERMRELGLLQALGMKPWMILAQIVVESVTLLLIGGVCGNLCAFLTVKSLSGGIDLSSFASAGEIIGVGSRIFPVILSRDLLAANVLTIFIGTLASLYPAWRASQFIPVEAMRKV